jgi:hypothetical protein
MREALVAEEVAEGALETTALMPDIRDSLRAVPADDWQLFDLSRPNERWLPLVRISDSGLWIGLDEEATWVVGRRASAERLTSEPTPAWMPLLDQDEDVRLEELTFSTERYKLPSNLVIESLPVDRVIAIALGTSSQHWVERAIRWLRHRPVPEQLLPLLDRVVTSSWASQVSRQQARQLLAEQQY